MFRDVINSMNTTSTTQVKQGQIYKIDPKIYKVTIEFFGERCSVKGKGKETNKIKYT